MINVNLIFLEYNLLYLYFFFSLKWKDSIIKNVALERTSLKPKSHVKQNFYLNEDEIGEDIMIYHLSFR